MHEKHEAYPSSWFKVDSNVAATGMEKCQKGGGQNTERGSPLMESFSQDKKQQETTNKIYRY